MIILPEAHTFKLFRRPQTVKALIHAGAELDAMDKSGWTALSRAADNGFDDVVRELCLAKADPSQKDLSNWSPLLRAACKGHLQTVRTLLLAGADITVRTQNDWVTIVKKSVPDPEVTLKEITGAWDRAYYKPGRVSKLV